MRPPEALLRRTLADARTRTLWFALIVFIYPLATVAGYKQTYKTETDRLAFAHSFGDNPAVKLFYGTPHRLDTLGGYAAWRAGGIAALFVAFVGLYAAVRAFRGEEESGRFEIVASGLLTRRAAFLARGAAIGLTLAALWLALLLGFVAGGLPAGGSAYLALGVIAVAMVYAGIGALCSQLAPTARGALELGGVVLALDFLLRVVADTTGTLWLHWFAPLGWEEELRAFSDPRPAVLLLPLLTTAVLLVVAWRIERGRDLGAALFAPRDTVRRPRPRLLRSPSLFALRTQRVTLAIWLIGVGGFGLLLGTLAQSIISGLSADLRQQLAKLGSGQMATAQGVLSFYFLFFILAIALFCCGQIGAAREEESSGRLETLFALAVDRFGFFGGRLALASGAALVLALAAGLGCAIGASASGASVSYGRLIAAGLNCLPASLLFLGLGALLIALVPRQGVGLAYGLVGLAFIWDLVGDLLGVPDWLLGLSPFHQTALLPGAAFHAAPAFVMLAIGLAAAAAALAVFRRRDLVGV